MIRWLALLILWAVPTAAQDLSALARLDPAQSSASMQGDALTLELALSQPVPYRIRLFDGPRRITLDFREVAWTDADRAALRAGGIAVGLGRTYDGWSRLVLPLSGPMAVTRAGMTVDPDSSTAVLTLRAVPTSAEAFAAKAEPAPSNAAPEATTPEGGPLIVVIDPGHGGVDPGAERGGVIEAELMLKLAIEVADALNRAGGIQAVLTRRSDAFVSLEGRMTIARAAGADLLISLHADALEEDEARGASVYTLSAEAEDRAAARMAERHDRADLVGGLDLSDQDDRVATVLMEMARTETGPASDRFADALVLGLKEAGVRLNSRPRRSGPLAVLNAADFPSVLLEAGFLSSAQDRGTLTSPDRRAAFARGIVDAVVTWAVGEQLLEPLLRN